MIEEFCARKGWEIKEYYIDYGFSGTKSDRPALQRMLKDIIDKKINVVLTKDYSRLGRDHVFTENLREKFFPKYQCRYIAIFDNIDTEYNDDCAPYKAVINSQYARDISNKVPFPIWWNRIRGFRNHYTKWELQDPEKGKYVWDDTVIGDMLINPVYYGAVSSQKKNYVFKVGVINEKKPDEWVIVENMHKPIIDQNSFDVVQKKIESRKCTRGDGTYSLFAGLIRCGECGKALTIRKTNAKNPQDVYACVTYNRHGKNHCTQHRVEYDTLYDIVYKEIKKLAKKTIDAEEVARSVAEAYENERKDQARLLEVGIKKAKDRLDVLDRMTTKLYEDLLAQKITEHTFNSMIMRTKKEQN